MRIVIGIDWARQVVKVQMSCLCNHEHVELILLQSALILSGSYFNIRLEILQALNK